MSGRQIRQPRVSAEVDGCETTGVGDVVSAEVVSPLAASNSAAPTTFSLIASIFLSGRRNSYNRRQRTRLAICYTIAAINGLTG
jgi:hypothetical protein